MTRLAKGVKLDMDKGIATMDFTFDPKTHTYKNKGMRIPSVTQILNEWILIKLKPGFFYVHTQTGVAISAETFRYAGERGTAVHSGAKLVLEGNLEWDVLDSILVDPLRQFEAWKKKHNVHIGVDTICEVAMLSQRYQYAGMPDIITPIKGVMSVIDIKTGTWGLFAAQLSAYERLFREITGYKKAINLFILDLSGKKYDFRQVKDVGAWGFFLNSLGCYKYKIAQK